MCFVMSFEKNVVKFWGKLLKQCFVHFPFLSARTLMVVEMHASGTRVTVFADTFVLVCLVLTVCKFTFCIIQSNNSIIAEQ